MNLSREIKKHGLKSVTNMARLLSVHRSTVYRAYEKDRELFENYLQRAKGKQDAEAN